MVAQIVQVLIYLKGTRSFNEVTFADFKVSDNLHVLKIIYNQAMIMDEYCYKDRYDDKNCKLALIETSHLETVFQSYISNDLEQLLKS